MLFETMKLNWRIVGRIGEIYLCYLNGIMLSEYFKQILFVHLYMACFFKTKEVLVLKKRGLGFKGTILWF